MVHKFRQTPERPFFRPPAKGPQAAPKSDPLRDRMCATNFRGGGQTTGGLGTYDEDGIS
jgi:hypothetical protein